MLQFQLLTVLVLALERVPAPWEVLGAGCGLRTLEAVVLQVQEAVLKYQREQMEVLV